MKNIFAKEHIIKGIVLTPLAFLMGGPAGVIATWTRAGLLVKKEIDEEKERQANLEQLKTPEQKVDDDIANFEKEKSKRKNNETIKCEIEKIFKENYNDYNRMFVCESMSYFDSDHYCELVYPRKTYYPYAAVWSGDLINYPTTLKFQIQMSKTEFPETIDIRKAYVYSCENNDKFLDRLKSDLHTYGSSLKILKTVYATKNGKIYKSNRIPWVYSYDNCQTYIIGGISSLLF